MLKRYELTAPQYDRMGDLITGEAEVRSMIASATRTSINGQL